MSAPYPCCEAAEQSCPQRRVIQFGQHRPNGAHDRCTAQILGDGVAADADRRGEAALDVAGSCSRRRNFSDLTHPQSLGWHGAPGVPSESLPSFDNCPVDCPRYLLTVAGFDRNP